MTKQEKKAAKQVVHPDALPTRYRVVRAVEQSGRARGPAAEAFRKAAERVYA